MTVPIENKRRTSGTRLSKLKTLRADDKRPVSLNSSCSFGLSHPAVFFSHNKPANSAFSIINQRNEHAIYCTVLWHTLTHHLRVTTERHRLRMPPYGLINFRPHFLLFWRSARSKQHACCALAGPRYRKTKKKKKNKNHVTTSHESPK
jgi:hypothetical protein